MSSFHFSTQRSRLNERRLCIRCLVALQQKAVPHVRTTRLFAAPTTAESAYPRDRAGNLLSCCESPALSHQVSPRVATTRSPPSPFPSIHSCHAPLPTRQRLWRFPSSRLVALVPFTSLPPFQSPSISPVIHSPLHNSSIASRSSDYHPQTPSFPSPSLSTDPHSSPPPQLDNPVAILPSPSRPLRICPPGAIRLVTEWSLRPPVNHHIRSESHWTPAARLVYL